jgi:hypothetical protein
VTALANNPASQDKLDELLVTCLAMQKLYGRSVENTEIVIRMFHKLLANQPAEKVTKAFEAWLLKSQEFPTPADIISLIQRNGKPPLKESDIIAIRKKDGEHRTKADWQMLAEWDAQQHIGWDDTNSDNLAAVAEIEKLRKELAAAKVEISRLQEILRLDDLRKNYTPPKHKDKVQNTLNLMKAECYPESDIQEFLASLTAVPQAIPNFQRVGAV